ncbi:hypothetical protein GCM10027072_71880 [Streptomyces bullii]
MLPGTCGSVAERAAVASAAGPAVVAASAVGTGLAVDATAGGVSGRARVAAQVTPIEEARNPRMPLILDISTDICPSGS